MTVTGNGPRGTPTRFSWCVCVFGIRGRPRRGMLRTHVNAEGSGGGAKEDYCCHLRVLGQGASHPALCGKVIPFRAGLRKPRPPVDPPAKGSLADRRTTRARAQTTPRFSHCSGRHRHDPGAGHPPTTVIPVCPLPPHIVQYTPESSSGRAGAQGNGRAVKDFE